MEEVEKVPKIKKGWLKFLLYVIFITLLLVVMLLLIRAFAPRQIDDISPLIPCEKSLIDKSDILFVIPKFRNQSIADNKTWCQQILALNKTLAMHGVYHTYYEFNETRDMAYIEEGKNIFKECFGFEPVLFKPPQMGISRENSDLIKKSGMKLIGNINQIFHKIYHCSDTGYYSNSFEDKF